MTKHFTDKDWNYQEPACPVVTNPKRLTDTERLDWLNNNFFNRENLDWNGDLCKEYLMWVFFAPTGVSGDIRNVLDAAILKQQQGK